MKSLIGKISSISFIVFFIYSTNCNGQIRVIPNFYKVIQSTFNEDSVENSFTKEKLWVKKNAKIFYLTKDYEQKSAKHFLDSLRNLIFQIKVQEFDNIKSRSFLKDGIVYKRFNQNLFKKPLNPSEIVVDLNKKCDCNENVFEVISEGLHLYEFILSPGDGSACNNPRNVCNSSESYPILELNKTSLDTLGNDLGSNISSNSNPLRIGILDTGIIIDSLLNSKNADSLTTLRFFFNRDFSGTPTKLNQIAQINLVENRSSLNQDSYHGTKIANIIINELKGRDVKIIPIKISNDCPGDLFNAMCGLLKAIDLKVDLINASWLYRGDLSILQMTKNIFFKLYDSKIIVVNSAGNEKMDLTNLTKKKVIFTPDPVEVIMHDTISILPVQFSQVFGNIITVSTLDSIVSNGKIEIGSRSNFSDKYIDAGVLCQCSYSQLIIYGGGVRSETINGFKIPGFSTRRCYFGTSYASAYFIAELAKTIKYSLANLYNSKNGISVIYRNSGVSLIPTSFGVFGEDGFKKYIISRMNLSGDGASSSDITGLRYYWYLKP